MSHRFERVSGELARTRFHRAIVPEPERYRSFRATSRMDGVRWMYVRDVRGIFHSGRVWRRVLGRREEMDRCSRERVERNFLDRLVLEDGSRRRVRYRDVILRSWSAIW